MNRVNGFISIKAMLFQLVIGYIKKKRKKRIIRYRGVSLKGTSFIPLVRRNCRGTTLKYLKLTSTLVPIRVHLLFFVSI